MACLCFRWMVRPGPVNARMHILGNEQDFYITMNSVTESMCYKLPETQSRMNKYNPWWRWGNGMGRRMLWTMNTGAFYWWHFECRDTVTRSWGPLLCHSSTTITSCCSMIMHSLMLQGSVHNSWKLKTSQFLHGQHTHRTCHPLSMFGMLWIGVYDNVFQFLSISSNITQPLKRSGPTSHRPQSTTWSTLCEGDVLHCVRQMVVTPDTDWFSAFYCDQPTAHLSNNHAV